MINCRWLRGARESTADPGRPTGRSAAGGEGNDDTNLCACGKSGDDHG